MGEGAGGGAYRAQWASFSDSAVSYDTGVGERWGEVRVPSVASLPWETRNRK